MCEQSRENCPSAKQEEALHLGKVLGTMGTGREAEKAAAPAVHSHRAQLLLQVAAVGLPHCLGAGTQIGSPKAARDRTIESYLSLGRDFKAHLVPTPCHGRDATHYIRLLRAPSSLEHLEGWAATVSVGNMCQCLTTL